VKIGDGLGIGPAVSVRVGGIGLDVSLVYQSGGGSDALAVSPELVAGGSGSTPYLGIGYIYLSESASDPLSGLSASASVSGFYGNVGYEVDLSPVWLQFGAGLVHIPSQNINGVQSNAVTGVDGEVGFRVMTGT
jgi:hypothetical protein